MQSLIVKCDRQTITTAIADLAARAIDLSEGSRQASRDFAGLIGPDEGNELDTDTRLTLLDEVIAELQSVHARIAEATGAADGTDTPDGPDMPDMPDMPASPAGVDSEADDFDPIALSPNALTVLQDYSDASESHALDATVRIGKGVPSAALLRAALIARNDVHRIFSQLAQGDTSELPYLDDFLDRFDEEEEPLLLIEAAVLNLSAIVENLEAAWHSGIDVPASVAETILDPYLAATSEMPLH